MGILAPLCTAFWQEDFHLPEPSQQLVCVLAASNIQASALKDMQPWQYKFEKLLANVSKDSLQAHSDALKILQGCMSALVCSIYSGL